MSFDPQKHHRRSIRLQGYDYARMGAYFVNVCAQNRECLFGDVIEDEMRHNDIGTVVVESWKWLEDHYGFVELDEWIVMPNHLHGILVITEGGSRTAPTKKRKPLGRLIGAFKTVSTKKVNRMRGTPAAQVWQRDLYERVIRNEDELNRIRRYIIENPLKWELDSENPAFVGAFRETPRDEIQSILEDDTPEFAPEKKDNRGGVPHLRIKPDRVNPSVGAVREPPLHDQNQPIPEGNGHGTV